MKKVLFVLGTRPEVIKLAPVIHEIQKYPAHFQAIVCATSQHTDMQNQMLSRFEIKPDVDLNVMKADQDLYHITTSVLNGLKSVLKDCRPDILFVQGDTTTTFAASLAAFYERIKVAHVEAGLRTFSRYSPFPEELNRSLTTRLADIHFAPTEQAKKNLLIENVSSDSIFVTGNTVIDSLFWIRKRFNKKHIRLVLPRSIYNLVESKESYVLITGHRRENFGVGFLSICRAILSLAKSYSQYHFIYPVHLNPNVRKPVFDLLKDQKNIHLIEPVDYEVFIYLMDHSYLILTDSGGVQEEAPSLGKPVLVMRETTERPEGVTVGTAQLVGTNEHIIIDAVSKLINDHDYYQKISNISNPYGDGTASKKIVEILKRLF